MAGKRIIAGFSEHGVGRAAAGASAIKTVKPTIVP
jgi:hypothetical protein